MNCEPASVVAAPVTRRLESEVLRLASTPRSTVSIVGELGVGKQAWARRLHAESARRAGPFVVAEPGVALSEQLFAAAEGGTLYLREVATLDASEQAMLVELLTHRAGPTTEEQPGGLRLVAASRRAPEQLGLREDLDYRLNVLVLEVPPLRERPEELLPLARHLLARAARELGLPLPALGEAAEASLLARTWPGNLHELALELRAGLLARQLAGDEGGAAGASGRPLGPLGALCGPNGMQMETHSAPRAPSGGDLSLETLEEQAIRAALAESGGNRSLAARRLGIHRTTLYHKLRRYGMG
ncbi:MAG: sigma 54-interacting transcriptional regulator [Planctomycetota bacterium]|nr:sigma 54-interacting transcriptional regulator [Planctomycetota bacterium]